ncbi:MAG: heparan-alpha-glucosaminide N-acetyltransferase domain-containing protein [bacterium]|jgi:uncharacterized membrane protein
MTINRQLQQGKTKRVLEIDALRGIAVLLMVFSHGLHWAYTGTSHDLISLFGSLSLGDLATPIFFLASGFSLYFSLTKRLKKGLDPDTLQKHYLIRLSKLFLIGVSLSLAWGVLQAQAVTLFLLSCFTISCLRRQHFFTVHSYFPQLTLATLSIHLLLSNLNLPPFWHDLLAGQFPLFAILTLNSLGFYLAPRLQLGHSPYAYLGLGLSLASIALLMGSTISPLKRPGAPLSFLLLGIGLSFCLLSILIICRRRKLFFFPYLAQIGKDALFLFIFHYLAFYVPLYVSGLLTKMDSTGALIFSSMMLITVLITAQLRKRCYFSIYHIIDLIFLSIWTCLLLPLSNALPSKTENYPLGNRKLVNGRY